MQLFFINNFFFNNYCWMFIFKSRRTILICCNIFFFNEVFQNLNEFLATEKNLKYSKAILFWEQVAFRSQIECIIVVMPGSIGHLFWRQWLFYRFFFRVEFILARLRKQIRPSSRIPTWLPRSSSKRGMRVGNVYFGGSYMFSSCFLAAGY